MFCASFSATLAVSTLGAVAHPVNEIHIPQPSYIEFIERNQGIVYPAVAGFVLLLILLGIFQSWRSHELDNEKKNELKKQIVVALKKVGGVAEAEFIASGIRLEKFTTVKLLEEMLKDGTLMRYTNTQRLDVWKLK